MIGVIGVLSVSGEYATGTMPASVLATPARGRSFAAKALVVTGVSAVAAQAVSFTAFLIGRQVFASGGAPHAGLGEPMVLFAVVGAGLYLALLGLLGLAIGFLVRWTAGGVIVMASITVLALAILRLLPAEVARMWPTIAGMEIIVPGSGLAGPGIYAAFVALCVVAALLVFQRRDVTE